MNRAEKRRQKKHAGKTDRIVRTPVSSSQIDDQQGRIIQQSLALATGHHGAGELSQAEALYQQILNLDPEQPDALHLLGITAHQVGNHERAVVLIQKALAVKPDYHDAHNNLGNVLQVMGRFEEAVTEYSLALTHKPDYADAHSSLGAALRALGKLDQAVVSYQQALALKPGLHDTWYNLANTLRALGQLDEAVAGYGKALVLKPDHAAAHCNLGNVLKDLGKDDAALTSYQNALSIKPDYAEAHYNLANALKDLGKTDEATSRYHRAIAANPNYAEAHNNLGNLLRESGDLEQAVDCFQKALAAKPDYPEAHSSLGAAYRALGKYDEALISYRNSIALKPDTVIDHHIAALLGKTTATAPREYVESIFDSYAQNFESHLVQELDYKIPALLKQIVDDHRSSGEKIKNAIDLGCGTGLSGVQFRDLVETLTGIDLSKEMVNKSSEKKIYDALFVDDVVSGLQSLNQKFELFISSDVFVYMGDLLPIFTSVKTYAEKKALFIFSTEHGDSGDFVLRNSGRYAHSKNYICSTASASGFRVIHSQTCKLRKDKSNWITGGVYLLQAA